MDTGCSYLKSFLKKKNEENFRLLYKKYTERMYRVAYRFLHGNVHFAEEAVQEAWLRALERLDGFRNESRFGTWLTGIVINCCREKARSLSKERVEIMNDKNLSPVSGPGTDIHSAIDLDTMILRLSDGYREILVLHDIEGFTHKEISEMLDISEGTSKSQLSRARAILREKLKTDYNYNLKENG